MEAAYHLARATGVCAATGEALSPGDPIVAAMVEDDSGLRRVDYSAAAWDSGHRPEGLFACWRTSVPSPDAPAARFVDDEELFDLFEQLGDDPEDSAVAFRYVLALLLIRKKVLTHEGAKGEVMQVRRRVNAEARKRGDLPPIIEVKDPGYSRERLMEVVERLDRVMASPGGAG
ncbi:MAG: hypothetical protein H6811_00030 [Phycisphaeraceae bacterium]|nr:hypothetical protein [Phycisphaeraceae bacterium]